MEEQAELDGNGMWAAFGASFLSGLKNMARPADPKAGEVRDNPDLNGREYTYTNVVDDFDVSLEMVLVGDNMADLLSKKDALVAALDPSQPHTFKVLSTDQTYNVKYNKISGFEFLRPANGVAAKMNLELTVLMDIVNHEKPEVVIDGNDTDIILDGNG